MKIRKGFLAMTIAGALGLGLAFAPQASAQRVFIRPYVGYRAFYGPGFYGPGWGWGYYPPAYVVGPATGQVKIDTKAKNDSIYVDGGYIGTTHDMKKFSLRPGKYDIEVKGPAGNSLLHESVQVIVGKTVDLKMYG
jgi:hypothetical protein